MSTKIYLPQAGKIELADYLRSTLTKRSDGLFEYPEGLSDAGVCDVFRDRWPMINANHVQGMRHALGMRLPTAARPARGDDPTLFDAAALAEIDGKLNMLAKEVSCIADCAAGAATFTQVERVEKSVADLAAEVRKIAAAVQGVQAAFSKMVVFVEGPKLSEKQEERLRSRLLDTSILSPSSAA